MDINTYRKKVNDGTIHEKKRPHILTTKARVWVDPNKCPAKYSLLDIEGKKFYIVYKANKQIFDVVNGFFIRGHQKFCTILSVGIASKKLMKEELANHPERYQEMLEYAKSIKTFNNIPKDNSRDELVTKEIDTTQPFWMKVDATKSQLTEVAGSAPTMNETKERVTIVHKWLVVLDKKLTHEVNPKLKLLKDSCPYGYRILSEHAYNKSKEVSKKNPVYRRHRFERMSDAYASKKEAEKIRQVLINNHRA